MDDTQTISASDFKARCLEIFDRLTDRTLREVTITKRGRAVGVLTAPPRNAETVPDLHGFMRGSVIVPDDVDLTAPISDEHFSAEDGIIHA